MECDVMRITTVAGTRSVEGELPRSTAYYYADLERLKRKGQEQTQDDRQNPDELSEYVESNEVVNDGAIREVPPFRDRRQWSLPEYTTPESSRKVPEETYSTAGTFPMPEQKEKEPLLAELEVVGRLPLTQLETTSGVRRSRSWYLCCPNVADEEISRESSWRYSSLRPVTAPPVPGQNGMSGLVTHSSGHEDMVSLRAERDALARALAAERQRAAAASRAHDARLAELHGVIAELVRRRAADKQARAIPEEELSDECESSTQPAGELGPDGDGPGGALGLDGDGPSGAHSLSTDPPGDCPHRVEPQVEVTSPDTPQQECDTSLDLSERDSEICLNTARCSELARQSAGGSCEREHGSRDGRHASAGPCESRQAKVASRVKLRRTEDSDTNNISSEEGQWAAGAAELALEVCAQADLREALVSAAHDECVQAALLAACRARCGRLRADCAVLAAAAARAADTAHRLYAACAAHESAVVCACDALRAADRALEAYDVLLALAETAHRPHTPERSAAELVARQLLCRLDAQKPTLGEPLLSPGPWLDHHTQACGVEEWSAESEARLRAHAARLKAHSAALRAHTAPPRLFSYHDIDEEDLPKLVKPFNMEEMEAAVMMQEVLQEREARASARALALQAEHSHHYSHKRSPEPDAAVRRDKECGHEQYKCETNSKEQWVHARAETDL